MFVDECSTNTSLSPIYGWSRKGKRVCFEAPRNWGANLTLLSSMSVEGMGASMVAEGSTTKALFETYAERVSWLPHRRRGGSSCGQPLLPQGVSG